jgi:hypothetical protein
VSTASLPAAQRSLIAARAANTRWARVNSPEARRQATDRASQGQRRKWERQVDPDGVMSPDELAAGVERLKKAHQQLMSLRSAQARAARKTS